MEKGGLFAWLRGRFAKGFLVFAVLAILSTVLSPLMAAIAPLVNQLPFNRAANWTVAIVFGVPMFFTLLGIFFGFVPRVKNIFIYFFMKKLGNDGVKDKDSWVGKEVFFDTDGGFHGFLPPDVQELGLVFAEEKGPERSKDYVWVLFVYSFTGTMNLQRIRKESGRLELTGGNAIDYAAAVISAGRSRHSKD